MNRYRFQFAALAMLVCATLVASAAPADQYSSGTRIKIHRAKLRAAQIRAEEGGSALEPCQTGNLEIGTIEADRGARVPSEVTVFVDGDVINLNDGRRTHVCR